MRFTALGFTHYIRRRGAGAVEEGARDAQCGACQQWRYVVDVIDLGALGAGALCAMHGREFCADACRGSTATVAYGGDPSTIG
jgi:hypothetical protein